MALGLLAAPAMTMAQETPRTPLSNLSFVSRTGTFTDLASYDKDAENAFTLTHYIKLGEDLAPGAALRDVFFVGDAEKTGSSDNNLADMFKTVTIDNGVATDDAERIQVAIPAMQAFGKEKFSYLYADMQGFVISALGGILFADGKTTTEDTKSVTCLCPQVKGWLTADQKELLRVIPCNTSGTALEPTKGTNAPVILAIGTDAEGLFIWTQFDYMIGNARWLFQIRYHENGLTDYIVGNDLGRSVLAENATSVFAPIAIQTKGSDRFQAYLLAPNTNASPAPGANCWELPILKGDYTEEAFQITPTCGPEPGHTISIIPHVSAASFSIAGDLTIAPTRLAGKMVFDPTRQAASLGFVEGMYLAVSPYEDPAWFWSATDKLPTLDYENNYGQFVYISDARPSDQQPLEMAFDVPNLKSNTDYYIHAMTGHRNLDKWSNVSYATYSVAVFGPYKTPEPPLAVIEDVNATVADGKINLTFQPAEDLATMVVKSPNATPKTPSGNLAVGDKIGESYYPQDTVALLLDAGVSTAELQHALNEGEGFYLHLYAVKDHGTENALYSKATTVSVYRPIETLPIEWSLAAGSDPKALPIGWSQSDLTGAEADFKEAAFAFTYVDEYIVTSLNKTLVAGHMSADITTPVFISPLNDVTATFNVKFYDFVDGWKYEPRVPQAGDSVRIDYRVEGGAWQVAHIFKEFPAADETGTITLYTTIPDIEGKRVEIRYTRHTATENTANSIVSVQITEEITCFPPSNLSIDTANVTDRQLALRWDDADNTTASYIVAYRETDAAETDLRKLAAEGKTAKLTGLNPNTAYRMQVQAVCAADDTSAFNATPVSFTTHAGLPYAESLANVYSDPNNPSQFISPAKRGVKTYTGKIGGNLTESDSYETWGTKYSLSGRTANTSQAMGTYEEAKAAVLVSPKIHTEKPTVLTVTLNSFSLKQKEDYTFELDQQGVAPTEKTCRLYIAVSDNGEFTMNDTILSLTGDELALTDSAFELNVEKTGTIQIAFFFDNPVEHWDHKFYLEAYNLSLTAVPEEYTLSLTASPAEGGTLTGAGKHKEGSDVTITATPNEGFDFVAWMNGTVQLATTASYTFKMPNADAAYTAVFKSNKPDEPEEEYELTLTASPANGGRVSGAGLYLADEEVTISAEANQGFKFVAWLNDTDTLSKEATHTFKMPDGDLSLTAKFIVETANEDAVKASFGVSTRDGRVHVRNLGGMTVNTVDIYTLTGNRLHRFMPNSREDLILPVDAERALLFIRIDAENGTAVYKVYLH